MSFGAFPDSKFYHVKLLIGKLITQVLLTCLFYSIE